MLYTLPKELCELCSKCEFRSLEHTKMVMCLFPRTCPKLELNLNSESTIKTENGD